MAGPSHIDITPRIGRGETTALDDFNIGELHDSFLRFKNAYIGNNAWHSRRADLSGAVSFSAAEKIRNMHFYNRVTGTDGTIQIDGIYQTNSHIYDLYFNSIATVFYPYEIYFETVKNRLFWSGANNAPSIWNGTIVTQWGADGPIGELAYTSYAATDIYAKVAIGTCGVAAGDATVTWTTGAVFTTGADWVGKTIVLDGVEYTILSVTNSTHLELTINYAGSTATVAFSVHYGSRSWTVAPKYAYAYYNPTTGHISSVSPVLTLSETVMSNVAVQLSGIATNSTLNDYGYTKIVIFRTGKDGSSLLPLELPGSVGDGEGFLNNSGGFTLSYNDEQGDEHLGAILGLKEAPFINDPAPAMKFIAYHDGRFWGIEEDRPWILRYSGDAVQIPLGVPEECWPDDNFREIPSPDGYGTGLRVVGDTLMVATQRYTFMVAGGGDNYRLQRLATRGFGTTQLGMAEHPGDSTEASASAIYVGRDKRLWRHFPGGRIEELGVAIQDKLDAVADGQRIPYIVHVAMTGRFWFLILGIATSRVGGGLYTGYDVMLYDFDKNAWYDWGYFDSGAAITAVQAYVGPTSGNAYIVMATSDSPPQLVTIGSGSFYEAQAQVLTRFQDFGRPEFKKQLQSIELWVDDPAQTFTVEVCFDGSETPSTTLVPNADPVRSKGSHILIYPMFGVKQWHTIAVRLTCPEGPVRGKWYKMRINLTPESTGAAGEP